MELRHLNYFLAVAEAGSVSEAARRINISQPALSGRLKDLEDEFGIKFFARHARGITLTDAGRRFLPHAQEITGAVDRAKQAFSEWSRPSLHVGITPTVGLHFLPELLQTCAQESDLSLVVRQASTQVLLSLLDEAKLDLVLSFGIPPRHPEIVTSFFEDDLVLVGRPEVVDLSSDKISFRELCDYPLVVEPAGHLVRKMIDDAAAKCDIRLSVVAEVEPVAAKRALLLRERVAAIVPQWVFRKEVQEDVLRSFRIEDPALSLNLRLAVRSDFPDELLTDFVEAMFSTVRRMAVTEPQWRIQQKPVSAA